MLRSIWLDNSPTCNTQPYWTILHTVTLHLFGPVFGWLLLHAVMMAGRLVGCKNLSNGRLGWWLHSGYVVLLESHQDVKRARRPEPSMINKSWLTKLAVGKRCIVLLRDRPVCLLGLHPCAYSTSTNENRLVRQNTQQLGQTEFFQV